MASQEDSTPWEEDKRHTEGVEEASMPGRGFFSKLGIVRRKPARPDAPPTMSKSCSDKLAAKQCLSLLLSTTALFVSPAGAYIDTLVLPEERFSSSGCQRAFGAEGRMRPMTDMTWADGYKFKPFKVETTSLDFEYAKSAVERCSQKVSASNVAAVWTLSGVEETILGGVIQGRKAFDVKARSKTSRRGMWSKANELGDSLGLNVLSGVQSYADIKALPVLANRAIVKKDLRDGALLGWMQNSGDDAFTLN